MKTVKSLIEKAVSLPTWIWATVILLLAAGTAVLNTVLKIGCLSKAIFNIPCPVCGMTRAYLSLLMLDFSAAMRYNPSCLVFPFICLFGILAAADKKRARLWVIAFFTSLTALFIIWAVRLITGTSV